jgi:DnaK suppressor protein
MEPDRILYFRERLETLRVEVNDYLDSSKGASDAVQLDTSIGRLSRMDAMQDQQMALELRRRKENQLLRIQSAMDRINQGSYGLCLSCKEPIAEERLELSPDAVICVKCSRR